MKILFFCMVEYRIPGVEKAKEIVRGYNDSRNYLVSLVGEALGDCGRAERMKDSALRAHGRNVLILAHEMIDRIRTDEIFSHMIEKEFP